MRMHVTGNPSYWILAGVRRMVDYRNYVKNEGSNRIASENHFDTRPERLTHLWPLGLLLVYEPPPLKFKAF